MDGTEWFAGDRWDISEAQADVRGNVCNQALMNPSSWSSENVGTLRELASASSSVVYAMAWYVGAGLLVNLSAAVVLRVR